MAGHIFQHIQNHCTGVFRPRLLPSVEDGGETAPTLPLNLVFEGDSITHGLGVGNLRSFGNMYGARANLGVANSTVDGAAPSLTNRAATLDALISPGCQNVLVVMTGNDMILDTAASMLTKMATYLDNRRAAGWYVIIWTVLPRTTAGFNTKRNTANATILTWAGVHCDMVVDFSGTSMGPDAAASDTSLYYDGIHPTLAGNRVLFASFQPILDALRPTTSAPMTGLAEHWKLNTGLTQSGGVASEWKGILKNLAISASGTARPAVQGDGSLLFDGSNDLLRGAFAWSPDGVTICLLAKQVTWTNTDTIIDGYSNYTATLFQFSTTPGLQGYNGTTFTTQDNNLATNTWAVIILTISPDGCVIQIDSATATTSAGLTPGNCGGLTLGAAGSASQFGNIQVKELLLYRGALDSTARAAVRAYLATVS